jgi:hypothetical protein
MICFNIKPKVEDNLTEFELRKIAEEKHRLKLENEKYAIKQINFEFNQNGD